ncbi:MAG: L-threonylcarbamoyladenylate synthase [Gammaproteobacteria bacterium]|nr:L-threonylcarbamoyladenylate synthase [Gammaproteobacteria bacterium]
MNADPVLEAVNSLKKGGVIAYPTESVFGLGCDPDNEAAVNKLLSIKQRDPAKGLILVASSFEQLKPYLQTVSPELTQQALSTWPGPYTWLWPAKDEVSTLVRGIHDTLAVRVSAHPVVQKLCKTFGKPIISTSANISDQPAAQTMEQVNEAFAQKLDYILEGEAGSAGIATEIRELTTNKVVRPGSNGNK